MAHPNYATRTRHFHAVQFYKDDDSLTRVVCGYLAEGFTQRQPGLVVATPTHCAAIEGALAARGFDVPRMKRLGDLVVLDARETLETIVVNGMPDPGLFADTAGRLLNEMSRSHPNRTIRGYGEVVDLLWKDGLTAAAIRLEAMWNEIAKSRDLMLLCAYSSGHVYKDAAVGEITGQHSHLIGETGETATIN